MPRVLAVTGVALFALAAACATRVPVGPAEVAGRLGQRTGAVPRVTGVARPEIPPGIRLDDGLTADDAVAVALWNNAAFQVSVSQLGFARADLLDAGLLPNPVLSLLFPVGPKQLEAALRWPIDVLWERPKRVAAARLASEAAAERLIDAGLDLVLAVRTAHTELGLATDRQTLAVETSTLLTRIATLTDSRLAAGDISAIDTRAARAEDARAQQDAGRMVHDVAIARDRLRGLMGLGADGNAFELAPSTPAAACGPAADLMREALVARPDVRAAELGVASAAARLGWEQSRILALTAVLDANGQGRDGFEVGPGIEVGLPVLTRNQGGRARAEAELQRASAAYAVVQQRVALELREASSLFNQARESLSVWRDRIVVPLAANVTGAERSFAEGDTSTLVVLEHSRRLTDARMRERELAADEQRARARIERAVGRSCSAPPQEAPRDR